MRKRIFLIANPGAGLAGSTLVEETMRALERAGAHVTRTMPVDIHAARAAARAAVHGQRYDIVVAAGGDGTIRHAAVALLGSDMPLGVIPTGTANVLAHEIGLVPKPEAIAEMLLTGPVMPIAAGRANGEPFLLMVGAGFDGRVIAGVDLRIKSWLGKAAFAAPLLNALAHAVDRLAVTVDGEPHEASWAIVTNSRHYAGRFVLTSRTALQQPGLEAVLFKAKNRSRLLGQLASLARGRLDLRTREGGDVEMVPCSKVTIAAVRPVPAQIDGDVFGTTPVEIEADSAEVRLVVPNGTGNASR